MEQYNCYIKGYGLPHLNVGSSAFVIEHKNTNQNK